MTTTAGEQPVRVQLRRSKGWKMPENTVVVSRPSKWGNPFPVGSTVGSELVVTRSRAVELYQLWLLREVCAGRLNPSELRGKHLACWCPLGEPCHADVLLELANS